MGLAQEYGRAEAENWANAPHANSARVAHAIEVNRVWVAESERDILGWIEVCGSTVQSLYVRESASGTGIGTRLMERGERCIAESGHRSADLEASPNAERFYRNRGYVPVGNPTSNGAIPMEKLLAPAA
jgi:GNAT superfamily N-acetyltransferase